MKIDFYKVEKLLEPYKQIKKQTSEKKEEGVAKVIQYVWNHTPTKKVDFDSFNLNGGLRAFYEFYFLPHYDDEMTQADLVSIKDNLWEINAAWDDLIYSLTKCNNKVYENEDDFI